MTVGVRRGRTVPVIVNGVTYAVELAEATASGSAPPSGATVQRSPIAPSPRAPTAPAAAAGPASARTTPAPEPSKRPTGVPHEGDVCAPISGVVRRVAVEPGQTVAAGTMLLVLEAMKMENEIVAPLAGLIEDVFVAVQQEVRHGEVLVRIMPHRRPAAQR